MDLNKFLNRILKIQSDIYRNKNPKAVLPETLFKKYKVVMADGVAIKHLVLSDNYIIITDK
jgi:hypothetical protein